MSAGRLEAVDDREECEVSATHHLHLDRTELMLPKPIVIDRFNLILASTCTNMPDLTAPPAIRSESVDVAAGAVNNLVSVLAVGDRDGHANKYQHRLFTFGRSLISFPFVICTTW
jgi:hypothetical protein